MKIELLGAVILSFWLSGCASPHQIYYTGLAIPVETTPTSTLCSQWKQESDERLDSSKPLRDAEDYAIRNAALYEIAQPYPHDDCRMATY
jgi:hypothetical protein